MGPTSGCLVLSLIYLTCDFNPLSIGGYPNIEYVSFPGDVHPKRLFYSHKAWANLKSVYIDQQPYDCQQGRCVLTAMDQPDFFPTPHPIQPSTGLETDTGQRSPHLIPTGEYHLSTTINPLFRLKIENGEGSAPVFPRENHPGECAISPPIKSFSDMKNRIELGIPNENQAEDVHRSSTIDPSVGIKTSSNQLKIAQISSTFEEVKKQMKTLYEQIKDLIIGFSSGILSIPILGGGFFIAVKIYRKRHPKPVHPHHLYLPLHNSSTINYECSEDEDIEVFDCRNVHQKVLTPTAPKRLETSPKKIIDLETSPKKIIDPPNAQPNLKLCQAEIHNPPARNNPADECQTNIKKTIKSGHRLRRSKSAEGIYNLRPREKFTGKALKKEKTMITEL